MRKSMFKRDDGCILATLWYGLKSYTVRIEPKATGFEATEVWDENKRRVSSDDRYQLMSVAVRELMTWYEQKLKPPSHVKVTFQERVVIAFALTLSRLEDDVKEKLVPLGGYDLRLMEKVATELSESVAKAKMDAKATGHKLPSGYLHELKREQLRRLSKIVLCSSDRRDFYSSVLSRVFAWKGGRIPHEDYETAKQYLPGLLLAFSLQN